MRLYILVLSPEAVLRPAYQTDRGIIVVLCIFSCTFTYTPHHIGWHTQFESTDGPSVSEFKRRRTGSFGFVQCSGADLSPEITRRTSIARGKISDRSPEHLFYCVAKIPARIQRGRVAAADTLDGTQRLCKQLFGIYFFINYRQP